MAYDGPSQHTLDCFLKNVLELQLRFATESRDKFAAAESEAKAVRPLTLKAELDQQQAWHLKLLFGARVDLLKQTIVDYKELFSEYLSEDK